MTSGCCLISKGSACVPAISKECIDIFCKHDDGSKIQRFVFINSNITQISPLPSSTLVMRCEISDTIIVSIKVIVLKGTHILKYKG